MGDVSAQAHSTQVAECGPGDKRVPSGKTASFLIAAVTGEEAAADGTPGSREDVGDVASQRGTPTCRGPRAPRLAQQHPVVHSPTACFRIRV